MRTETYVALGGDQQYLRGVEPGDTKSILAFYIRLQHRVSKQPDESWQTIVGIQHEPRPSYPESTIFDRGIVAQFFKDGCLRDERRYCDADQFEGCTNDDCLSAAQEIVRNNLDDIREASEI
jgi:hypothetical protein